MRSTWVVFGVLAACGGNNVDPRAIPGGGISDGAIDGEVNVTVVDDDDNLIVDAEVQVGGVTLTTDDAGVAVFSNVTGPQTIAVKATGHRSVVWVGANGANVTIPVSPLTASVPEQATVHGTITGWDGTTGLAPNHIRAAVILYSQSDDLGDAANNLTTPLNGNICGVLSNTCDWTLVSRAGSVTLIAAVIERDTKGTPAADDDTNQIIGWASKSNVVVQNGIPLDNVALAMVEAGNLETVTVDLGTPPPGLPQTQALVGIESDSNEVIQLPLFLNADQTSLLSPKPSVFAATATYRLTAIAQTTTGAEGAQSILLRRGNTTTALAAGQWLVPPTGLAVTRADASWDPVAGATVQQVQYKDANGTTILEVSTFDNSAAVVIPSLVALPATGTLSARVSGIGATLNVHDFSLENDKDQLFGIAEQPATVP